MTFPLTSILQWSISAVYTTLILKSGNNRAFNGNEKNISIHKGVIIATFGTPYFLFLSRSLSTYNVPILGYFY